MNESGIQARGRRQRISEGVDEGQGKMPPSPTWLLDDAAAASSVMVARGGCGAALGRCPAPPPFLDSDNMGKESSRPSAHFNRQALLSFQRRVFLWPGYINKPHTRLPPPPVRPSILILLVDDRPPSPPPSPPVIHSRRDPAPRCPRCQGPEWWERGGCLVCPRGGSITAPCCSPRPVDMHCLKPFGQHREIVPWALGAPPPSPTPCAQLMRRATPNVQKGAGAITLPAMTRVLSSGRT